MAQKRMAREPRIIRPDDIDPRHDWPPAIIDRLNAEVTKIMGSAEVKERHDKLGAEAFLMAPAAFDRFIVDETAKTQQLVRAAGIKLN